MIWLVWCSTD